MKAVIVISLISSLQVYHQTVPNNVPSDFGGSGSGSGIGLFAAAFPVGQLLGTALVVAVCERFSVLAALDLNAICLILGGLLAGLLGPLSNACLILSRVIIGIGVGSGFVVSSAVIHDSYRPDDRQAAFFVAAMLFAAGGLYSNIVVHAAFAAGYWPGILAANGPAVLAGLIYFLQRPLFFARFAFALEPVTLCERRAIRLMAPGMSSAILLMVLNASLAVPIVMAFSTAVFTHLGIGDRPAERLSIFYPLLQLTLLSGLATPFVNARLPSRKAMITVGNATTLFLMFCFLLAVQGIEEDVDLRSHRPGLAAGLFIAFAVVACVPCNTAFCFITESFPTRESQIRALARSRMVLWVLSAVESYYFLPKMKSTSLCAALAPYLIVSVVVTMMVCSVMSGMDDDEFGKEKVTPQVEDESIPFVQIPRRGKSLDAHYNF